MGYISQFGIFEARVIDAAKAAGTSWGVWISVPDGCCERPQAGRADNQLLEKKLHQMTGSEIVALAKQGVSLSRVNETFLTAPA